MSNHFSSPAATSRRRLLGGLSAAALVGGLGMGVSSCRTNNRAGTGTGQTKEVVLPTYQSYDGVKPDLPPTDFGVDAGYFAYPKENPPSLSEKPGDGSAVTAVAPIYSALPPGIDRNPYWQGMNKQLGIDLQLEMVPGADYPQKFALVIASRELPDLVLMPAPASAIANLPQLLESQFTDLSPYLAGDKALDYPNLANILTTTWKTAAYNGGIYGAPIPRGVMGAYVITRQDIFEEMGASVAPKGFDEFLATTKTLSDRRKSRWAFSLAAHAMSYVGIMNEVPNGWRIDGGKLVNQYESEEFKQSVTDVMALWKAGVIHPDGFSTSTPSKQLFTSGTVSIVYDGMTAWGGYVTSGANNPKQKLGLMPVYNRTGDALAPWPYSSGAFSFCAIRKQESEDRLRMLLRVMSYLAAPFGSAEHRYRSYGEEGVNHKLDTNGNPVLIPEQKALMDLPISYVASPPFVLFSRVRPDDVKLQHAYQTQMMAKPKVDPTLGIYSPTFAEKNAASGKKFTDGVNDIIQGRQPMSTFEKLLSDWRQAGGDKMRAEFEDQL